MNSDDNHEALRAEVQAALDRADLDPTEGDLAMAPFLDRWEVVRDPFDFTIMLGRVTGHPTLRGPAIRTSPLMRLNAQAGWARTFSRFYRLGMPLSKVDPDSRATFLAAAATKGFGPFPRGDFVDFWTRASGPWDGGIPLGIAMLHDLLPRERMGSAVALVSATLEGTRDVGFALDDYDEEGAKEPSRGKRPRKKPKDIEPTVVHHYPQDRNCTCCGNEMPSINSWTGTRTGYFWAVCRDERNWNPNAEPAVIYHYAPFRPASLRRGSWMAQLSASLLRMATQGIIVCSRAMVPMMGWSQHGVGPTLGVTSMKHISQRKALSRTRSFS